MDNAQRIPFFFKYLWFNINFVNFGDFKNSHNISFGQSEKLIKLKGNSECVFTKAIFNSAKTLVFKLGEWLQAVVLLFFFIYYLFHSYYCKSCEPYRIYLQSQIWCLKYKQNIVFLVTFLLKNFIYLCESFKFESVTNFALYF